MARPPKDKSGISEKWRGTSMRLPRWLADQIRDRATEAGFAESWEILLHSPRFTIPNPLPRRYVHHGAAFAAERIVLLSDAVEEVVAELRSMNVRFTRIGDTGIEPDLPAGGNIASGDGSANLAAKMAFDVQVREAYDRVRERRSSDALHDLFGSAARHKKL